VTSEEKAVQSVETHPQNLRGNVVWSSDSNFRLYRPVIFQLEAASKVSENYVTRFIDEDIVRLQAYI